MRRNIIIFGLIAGVITTSWTVSFIAMDKSHFTEESMEKGMIYGYLSMLLAFSMIFVAVKNYRDKYNGGSITFGKAFKIGLGITVIASTVYVVVWLIDYFYFFPDFMEKYGEMVIKKMEKSGEAAKVIEEKRKEMKEFKVMYDNPFFNAMITYTEILPVGLIMSLIGAAVLKRKPKPDAGMNANPNIL